ncbi:DUF1524 domain-containing protein [Nocardia uniformis]|uniref:DUF1524 domain-containing protein n=1 Tax=Nocardia uniformis TaxID=53432 RepID=A0A849BVP9_9NOCA|nr:DUF1524 domain-containing protein [Nocardia uniformis]NNH69026.1 DUF1524 domain-containing protein [Nocardia uniformis]
MLKKKPSRARKLLLPLAIAVLLAVLSIVLTTFDASDTPTSTVPGDQLAAARTRLEALPVKNWASKDGYSRDQFGPAWTDNVSVELGNNGCDTRNDILQRDLRDEKLESGGCKVLSGTLVDPYTGKTITFKQGRETSAAVQIDHIVALSNAWLTGAQQLTPEQRRNLANDPRNLVAVDGPTNQGKGDSDAGAWLPPRKEYHCLYVAKQIEVKAAYNLWVTRAEHDNMTKVLNGCGESDPTSAAPTTTAPPTNVSYKNCDEVRAAGAAPLRRGQPGYRPQLDGNGDGVACE